MTGSHGRRAARSRRLVRQEEEEEKEEEKREPADKFMQLPLLTAVETAGSLYAVSGLLW